VKCLHLFILSARGCVCVRVTEYVCMCMCVCVCVRRGEVCESVSELDSPHSG
jgi:hypothetical protein